MATIEIDGKTIEVENGKMIIEVADEQGIYIPRFCYHKKLSVAANCRMCLVEVENSKKTVPACATPINHGMKIFTKSSAAIKSQEAVMEFLLINHPLDCPICDQGGECDLQDVSMGFGRDKSDYSESKRSVVDDNLGTLIATEMTRCIQCTRCVRFGDEIAGLQELGGIGRGEAMQIGTYVENSMKSEISANIIDLCPVGALTSKPYRFTARAWEMMQAEGVAPHDCLGSNIYMHTRRNELMRVVPKECEYINETWLSDRDRFSYLGLKSANRAAEPMIKENGHWKEVDWQTALSFAAKGISNVIEQYGPEEFASFASPSSTLEEMYLLQKLMREIKVFSVDSRLQQTDFRDDANLPIISKNQQSYVELENQDEILIVGCNIDREVPLALTKIRKALTNGAKINAINVVDYTYKFEVDNKLIISQCSLPIKLATLLQALIAKRDDVPEEVLKLTIGLNADEITNSIAHDLLKPKAVIITGAIIDNHPEASILRTLISLIAEYSGAKILKFTTGANSLGAKLVGLQPLKGPFGKVVTSGLNVKDAIDKKLKGYLLMASDPSFDFANPFGTRKAMLSAEFVVQISAFVTDSIKESADVILPMAPFSETSGTYVNIDNRWQTTKGCVQPYKNSRPAWKILRVLANILHCRDFDYVSSEDVLDEIKVNYAIMDEVAPKLYYPDFLPTNTETLTRVGEWPLYACDQIVRHAQALQKCGSAEKAVIRVNQETVNKYKLGDNATISQGDIEITLPLLIDERISADTVWVANALAETVDLGHSFAPITIK
jgi:NADH-quinone oxidoreductase subunit G